MLRPLSTRIEDLDRTIRGPCRIIASSCSNGEEAGAGSIKMKANMRTLYGQHWEKATSWIDEARTTVSHCGTGKATAQLHASLCSVEGNSIQSCIPNANARKRGKYLVQGAEHMYAWTDSYFNSYSCTLRYTPSGPAEVGLTTALEPCASADAVVSVPGIRRPRVASGSAEAHDPVPRDIIGSPEQREGPARRRGPK